MPGLSRDALNGISRRRTPARGSAGSKVIQGRLLAARCGRRGNRRVRAQGFRLLLPEQKQPARREANGKRQGCQSDESGENGDPVIARCSIAPAARAVASCWRRWVSVSFSCTPPGPAWVSDWLLSSRAMLLESCLHRVARFCGVSATEPEAVCCAAAGEAAGGVAVLAAGDGFELTSGSPASRILV